MAEETEGYVQMPSLGVSELRAEVDRLNRIIHMPQAEAKHTLLEMAHRLDTLDVRVYRAIDKTLRVKNGVGKERVLTRTEKVAWLLFGAKPERV